MQPTDVRGFDDTLKPLRVKREWELDAARAHLARLCAEADERERKLDEQEASAASQSRFAVAHWRSSSDPQVYARSLSHLLRLQQKIAEQRKEMERLFGEISVAREETLRAQRSLEILLRHRKEALAAHLKEAGRKAASNADQEWLMRVAAQQGGQS